MRNCPRCLVEMSEERRKFASIDRCPKCAGVFLDAGEGVTAMGQREDVSTLAQSGAAKIVGHSAIGCPNGHGAMTLFRFGEGASPVEIDVCTSCQGAFFDAGETEILDEITSRAGEHEVTTATGARFSAPPAMGGRASHESVVDQYRAEQGGNAFATFFSDLARATSAVASAGAPHGRRRGLRWRW
jgi:uncharacterized protein